MEAAWSASHWWTSTTSSELTGSRRSGTGWDIVHSRPQAQT